MGIYVWGTGCGASELIDRGVTPERIAAFVESKPVSADFLSRPVLTPEAVPVPDCDLMIVTTRHGSEIAGTCETLGIPAERCLFLKNSVSLRDRNDASRDTAYQILGEALAETLLASHHIVPTPCQLRDTRLTGQEMEDDYVRMGTLELLCRRLETEDRPFRKITFPRYGKPSAAMVEEYLHGNLGKHPGDVNAYAASLFYAMDRYASWKQDWGTFYEDGGLIVADRYTTSNAVHQASKLPEEERKAYAGSRTPAATPRRALCGAPPSPFVSFSRLTQRKSYAITL